MSRTGNAIVRYLGAYEEGHHVCDIRDGTEWEAQVRFRPTDRTFFLFLANDTDDVFQLRAKDYGQLRQFCLEHLVKNS